MKLKMILNNEKSIRLARKKEERGIFSSLDDKTKTYTMEGWSKGKRVVMHKISDEVHLYTDLLDDVTMAYPEFVLDSLRLSQKDYIIDGNIIEINNKAYYQVFDIVYFNGQDLHSLSWSKRKKLLHTLDFTNIIREVDSIIVKNSQDAKETIKMFSSRDNLTHVVLKDLESPYSVDGETNWVSITLGGVDDETNREHKHNKKTDKHDN